MSLEFRSMEFKTDGGYGPEGSARQAFFPLYPLLARAMGALGGGGAVTAKLVAGISAVIPRSRAGARG